jgi:hypothetical protein
MTIEDRTNRVSLARVAVVAMWSVAIGTAAAQSTLRITSPTEGTIVAPGSALTVSVEATPFAFQNIMILAAPIDFGDPIGSPPYTFHLSVPADTPSGIYTIEALGVVGPGNWVYSDSVTIDVERTDSPQKLTAVLKDLYLDGPGDSMGMQLKGDYADGSTADLTHSKWTTYNSYTPAVATVDANGVVTAVAPGYTPFSAHYKDLELVFSATVAEPVSIAPRAAVLYGGGTQQFIAHASAGAADVTVTWSLGDGEPGSIDETGLYTAPATVTTPRTVRVMATDSPDATHRGTAWVYLYPPPTLSLAPSALTLGPSGWRTFTATVDNPPNALIVWSAEPAGVGYVDPAEGYYVAPEVIESPQSVTITAMAMTEPVLTATATISLVPVVEAISTPNRPDGPTSGATGALYQFTASGGASNLGNPIQYSFNWGDGDLSGWTRLGVNSSFHAWRSPGSYVVRVIAGSRTDPSLFSAPSEPLSIVISGESITVPQVPTGFASVVTGTSYSYSTGGASSSAGHPVQYRLLFSDGSTSPWLPVGTTSASHTWQGSGTYTVTAQARCANDKQVMSTASMGLAVTVADGETVSTPDAPSGALSGSVGSAYTYSTGHATTSSGNPAVYLFDWGDGTTSGWLRAGSTTATHSWPALGSYTVTVLAADQYYLLLRSAASAGTVVQIQ